MERLSAVLGQAVQFVYTCWDRIVLSGYIERLQRPENLIYFFHDIVGIDAIEPAVLEQRTNTYKAWVRRITDERGIPVLGAPSGVRKEELVEPYYRRLKGSDGVACVLTGLEQGRTFVSYTPHRKPPSGDVNYRLIKACRTRFLHYYWYVLDPVMGPMSLLVASYFPFNVTCYLNGHSFVAEQLRSDGVRFRKADNAFLAVGAVDALQTASDRLTATLLQRCCNYWLRRLVPVFSPAERDALRPGYRYSMAQMELATDVIFKRAAPLKAMFRRACDLGLLVGGANRTTHLFCRRISRHYQGKLQTVLDQREVGHPPCCAGTTGRHSPSSTSVAINTAIASCAPETCSNDTYHFGIGRRLENLPLLHEKLAAINDRCLDEQAELLTSAVDTGQLADLPTWLNQH
jgi:hypothetical protein